MAIVYQHRRKDTNEVFYIGIASVDTRPYSKQDRNKYWKNIVNAFGYEVDILINGCTWEQACEIEKGMIADYGRRDLGTGKLVNMSEGGVGGFSKPGWNKGISPSKETVKKSSEAHLKYYASLTEEEKKRKCATFGMLGKKHKDESKEKTRLSLIGRTREKTQCPHCKKWGGPGGFHRYHFENCKNKK
jgi:hypothetical protein